MKIFFDIGYNNIYLFGIGESDDIDLFDIIFWVCFIYMMIWVYVLFFNFVCILLKLKSIFYKMLLFNDVLCNNNKVLII